MTHAYSMYLFFSQSESMKLKVSRYYQYSNVVGENQGSSLSSPKTTKSMCETHRRRSCKKHMFITYRCQGWKLSHRKKRKHILRYVVLGTRPWSKKNCTPITYISKIQKIFLISEQEAWRFIKCNRTWKDLIIIK